MIFREANIEQTTLQFFRENKKKLSSLGKANAVLAKLCGIVQFFNEEAELIEFEEKLQEQNSVLGETNRRAYGDFQTNMILAKKVSKYILEKGVNPEFVLESSCGKGNFLLAAITTFKSIKKIVGVEIYQPYVWETKFKILAYYLQHKSETRPEIEILHANVFEYPFKKLAEQTLDLETLIIGNPPWVTNSELGAINSKNLPRKVNLKKHKGLDAITGKGNFDIGEYISMLMLENFHKHTGYLGFLIKNSVIKNIVFDQKKNKYKIGKNEKLNIDSKKEFNAAVNASLFLTQLNTEAEFVCQEYDFYTQERQVNFGWHKDKFVYSISKYKTVHDIDGKSQFVWRQGLKHDCSKIMELDIYNSHYSNGFKEEVILEKNLVYGLLKSSDLKERQTNTYRKSTIVTQKKVGQATQYIQKDFPLTYKYLTKNEVFFAKRKSSIYKGKPKFSIFGIGDYSFAPYKIAVSGLYKTTHFTLVFPDDGKPIMLDDTCYFIGFNNLKDAQIVHFLLNHDYTQQFFKSIIFPDAKRSITKDLLMRIDLLKVYNLLDFKKSKLAEISEEDWDSFGKTLNKDTQSKQMTLF